MIEPCCGQGPVTPPTPLAGAAPPVKSEFSAPEGGWRSVLLEKGPAGYAKAVREHTSS